MFLNKRLNLKDKDFRKIKYFKNVYFTALCIWVLRAAMWLKFNIVCFGLYYYYYLLPLSLPQKKAVAVRRKRSISRENKQYVERNPKAAGLNIKSTFINQIVLIRILCLSVSFCESEPGSAVHGSEKNTSIDKNKNALRLDPFILIFCSRLKVNTLEQIFVRTCSCPTYADPLFCSFTWRYEEKPIQCALKMVCRLNGGHI